jgi:lipoate-protein ligase A
MDARLIVDEPHDGAWNMAVDEALAHQAGESGVPVLRLYQWAEPTLSLGYFQTERHTSQVANARWFGGVAAVGR